MRALREQSYDTPTPVQRAAIPAILGGEDLLAAAQTDTGKTAGFALPLLRRVKDDIPPGSVCGKRPGARLSTTALYVWPY